MGKTLSDEEKVLALMSFALMEMRMYADEGNNKACFHLADLLHNAPAQLRTERAGDGNYKRILDWIAMRAEQKGMSSWLRNAEDQLY